MFRIGTIIYALALIINSSWKYRNLGDFGAFVFEALAGLALILCAAFLEGFSYESAFYSHFLVVGIALVLVIFFTFELRKHYNPYFAIQLFLAIQIFGIGFCLISGIL